MFSMQVWKTTPFLPDTGSCHHSRGNCRRERKSGNSPEDSRGRHNGFVESSRLSTGMQPFFTVVAMFIMLMNLNEPSLYYFCRKEPLQRKLRIKNKNTSVCLPPIDCHRIRFIIAVTLINGLGKDGFYIYI